MNQDCGMIRKEEYWNMLRCFSKLKGYEGWLLAKMNWHATALSGKEAKQQSNIVRAEKKYQTEEQKDPIILDKENINANVIEDFIYEIENGSIRHDSLKTAYLIFSYLMKDSEK